eukprot:1284078-Pleurochrysis_carterae.AAC.1
MENGESNLGTQRCKEEAKRRTRKSCATEYALAQHWPRRSACNGGGLAQQPSDSGTLLSDPAPDIR